MRKRGLITLVAAIGAVVVALPLAASADDKERIVLTERMQITSFDPVTGKGTQAGSFVATGAVNDAGPAAATFQVTPGKGGCGVLTGPHTYTGANGTFTVFTTAAACPYPPSTPPRSFARGTWRVIGASGGYTGLHGRGHVYATADFTNGQITIARDGRVGRDA